MPQPNDLSWSLVALDQNNTIIAVIEMSQSSWLVAGMLPGIERQPRKKLEPSPERLLAVLIAGGMRRSGPAALSRGLRAQDLCRTVGRAGKEIDTATSAGWIDGKSAAPIAACVDIVRKTVSAHLATGYRPKWSFEHFLRSGEGRCSNSRERHV